MSDTRSTRPTVTLVSGTRWEFRGFTPAGMVRLWAIGGGASLTADPADVTDLCQLPGDVLAEHGIYPADVCPCGRYLVGDGCEPYRETPLRLQGVRDD